MAIVITHQKFDPKTFEYDLALLRFHEPVEFQPNIIPVCIPDSDEVHTDRQTDINTEIIIDISIDKLFWRNILK